MVAFHHKGQKCAFRDTILHFFGGSRVKVSRNLRGGHSNLHLFVKLEWRLSKIYIVAFIAKARNIHFEIQTCTCFGVYRQNVGPNTCGCISPERPNMHLLVELKWKLGKLYVVAFHHKSQK